MASDDRKIKTKPAPKNDTLPKNKSTPDAAPSKAEGGEKDIPGRVQAACRSEAFSIRIHVLLPEFPLLNVRKA